MTDTDSKMMRAQQNKDARQTIEPDETHPRPQAHDSDAASGRDRDAAAAGTADVSQDQMDAIFAENKHGGKDAPGAARPAAAPANGGRGLAGKGRSLLGD